VTKPNLAALLTVILLVSLAIPSAPFTTACPCDEPADESSCASCHGVAPSPLETFHYITVEKVKGRVLIEVDSMQPPPDCALCVEETGDVAPEVTITENLLWSKTKVTGEVNRTLNFTLLDMTAEGTSVQLYKLSYLTQHEDFNVTIQTLLTLPTSGAYNSCFTIVIYMSAEKSELVSLELVQFNSSLTLAEHYAVLSKVAKEVGKIYKQSDDEVLDQLADSYKAISKEVKVVGKWVKKHLASYDKPILDAGAMISDGSYWDCVLCMYLALRCSACVAFCASGIGAPLCLLCLATSCPLAYYYCCRCFDLC